MRTACMILAAFLLVWVVPAYAEECEEVGVRVGFSGISISKNVRVIAAAAKVKELGNIGRTVAFCTADLRAFVIPMTVILPPRPRLGLMRYGIIITDFVAEQFSDNGPLGLVAHELGHVATGPMAFGVLGGERSVKYLEEVEFAADRYAVNWVGPEAVSTTFEEVITAVEKDLRSRKGLNDVQFDEAVQRRVLSLRAILAPRLNALRKSH